MSVLNIDVLHSVSGKFSTGTTYLLFFFFSLLFVPVLLWVYIYIVMFLCMLGYL